MKKLLYILLILAPGICAAQEFVINNGTNIRINPGCQVIFADGGIRNSAGQLTNAGELVVEGNIINNATLSGGNTSGIFRVLNDIENNGDMLPGQSEFELYGEDQLLFGTQQLNFHHLTLTGTGVKHAAQNISTLGTLQLNDRELSAAGNTVFHENTDANSIQFIHTEGFVSSTAGGGLSRRTNSAQEHIFPVGSAVGTFRYRPIILSSAVGQNVYKVRFANTQPPSVFKRGAEIFYINPAFYHNIQRTEGVSNVDVSVFFDPLNDGNFETLAHLDNASLFWKENAGTDIGPLLGATPDFDSFKTIGWGFSDPEIALATLATPLFVPNVFSPNQDGQNDKFKARGTEPYEYQMRIYDRWGNKVFETESIAEGWDGTYRGKLMNSAVFVYYILSAGEVVDKGNVTLLR